MPDQVKLSFVIFSHPGTLTLIPERQRDERQSAWMSKITNDGFREGTVLIIYLY